MAVSETRVDVGPADAFADGSLTRVEINGHELVVAREDGVFYAFPDRCTHAKYPLHDGELLGGRVKCVHHGATFDLETGRPTLPAVKKLRLYQALVEDGRLLVSLQET